MKRVWRTFAAALGLVLPVLAAQAAPATQAAPIAGVVTRVIDGDTLVFQPAGKPPIDVRLRDIDAPEICQPWGVEAKTALEEMALGKQGTLIASARDVYGRTVGLVTVDEQSLSKRLVEDGHAWSTRTKWDNGPLVKQERQAKALSRGLHSQAGAIPPKEFRRVKGACPPPAAVHPNSSAAVPPELRPASTSTVAAAAFRCDGRTRCHQLTSCAEARYFLANCPGVQIDGDHDGIPCEDRLCADER